MKPLTYKSRYISILILFIAFIIIAPILISHALGYRISTLGESIVVKTGGLYINSANIANTEVYIDGEFVKDGGLFVRNTFIEDLNPNKEYEFLVKKTGYNDYVKTVNIYPSLVTEMKVLMLPKEILENKIPKFIQGIDLNQNSAELESLYNKDFIYTLELFDLTSLVFEEEVVEEEKNTLEKISENIEEFQTSNDIPEYFANLGIKDPTELENLIEKNNQVSWLEDGNINTYWIGEADSIPYYYCQEIYVCGEGLELDWEDEILAFDFLPNREDVWIVLTENGLYAVELDKRGKRNIQPVYLGQDLDFRINANNRIVVKYKELELEPDTEVDTLKTETKSATEIKLESISRDLPDFVELIF